RRATLERGQMRGLGENQQLVQRVYTQSRDQIQARPQPDAAQQVHRLFERNAARELKGPERPPDLVGDDRLVIPQQHFARLLFVFDHLPDNLAQVIEQLLFGLL